MGLMSKFYTKAGRLRRYALACGYIEQREINGIQVTMWSYGGCYPVIHIRAHDFNEHKRLFWDTTNTLKDARIRFDRAVREIPRRTEAP